MALNSGMPGFDATFIRDALRRLRSARPNIFGAASHEFALNAALSEADVLRFEQQHAIRLPADYRHFLTELGNGGAGPHYGIFPIGSFDGVGGDLQPWGDLVGTLAEPFGYREAWNDLTGNPAEVLAESDEDEYWRRVDVFERRYWHSSAMNGAFPICHMGCALRIWLVVSGDEAGNVWYDRRADCEGIAPVLTHGGNHASFGGWYMQWLDEVLHAADLG